MKVEFDKEGEQIILGMLYDLTHNNSSAITHARKRAWLFLKAIGAKGVIEYAERMDGSLIILHKLDFGDEIKVVQNEITEREEVKIGITGRKKILSKEEVEKIFRMKKNKKSNRSIARVLNVSEYTVRKYIKENKESICYFNDSDLT